MTGHDVHRDRSTPDETRHLVLDDDGVDRLELVLGGWLSGLELPVAAPAGPGRPTGEVVLTDAENTPLAVVAAGTGPRGLPSVRPLGELPRGLGPQWDPAIRLDAETVREQLAPVDARRVLAVVVDDLPLRADEGSLLAAGDAADAMLVVVPVRRGNPPGEDLPAAGRVRAALALADALEAARPAWQIVRLVVPGPTNGGVELAERIGVALVTTLSALRSEEQAEQARTAARSWLSDDEIDAWYPPASAREILRARQAASQRGAVVFFTGLSGSGKSTIARALAEDLVDRGPRRVTLLDGDEVRQHLSRGLGFDAVSRAINIDRIAWVASLVAAHGGIAVACPIAPFADGRRAARAMAERHGVFLLVHVSTPLEVCEARDRKGLYARARAGELPEFTGISSPYEVPDDADVTLDTTDTTIEAAVGRIRDALERGLHGDSPTGR